MIYERSVVWSSESYAEVPTTCVLSNGQQEETALAAKSCL